MSRSDAAHGFDMFIQNHAESRHQEVKRSSEFQKLTQRRHTLQNLSLHAR